MKNRLRSTFSGDSVGKRALRGSALTVVGFGGSKVLRLASNLLLTRLLFPEAFGLMALVQVFMAGLAMFSDIGIKTSIIQNPRGDEPEFLNTAWTMQIARGVFLWLAACALALPAASLYDEPMLSQLLPVAGLSALIAGFRTTKIATANRHLMLGRQTVIDLGAQVVGIIITVSLAYMLRSVWALVIGGLISEVLRVVLFHLILPGIRNRLYWERETASGLIRFGKYIFLGTVAGFAINQGDRAVLGGYVSLSELGVYSIGMLLGTMPLMLGMALNGKIVLPLYRMKPPAESMSNRRQISRARRLLVTATFILNIPLAYAGIALIETLYDPRYVLAGPIVVLVSLAAVPQLVFNGYGGALLANGDSKRHFILLSCTAAAQLIYLFVGVNWYGLFGAILAPGLAALTTYPMRIVFVARYKANDHWSDLRFLALGLGLTGFACWLHLDDIMALIP
ncbi:O-antigen/teichoic acid export membrane protein [Litoreibacter meonggei]|uniref:O-antigen/teichoic acid export membrane protein n=1 Tax=Litoreibacter meonggei TaxID=1049199 RepID=A0A497UZD5_9RHOB|nr:oligosaccharide flippase family protein [Litoreibacter meonggei]RLJ36202.1 O-antigen/teichoic acid export membrane protein [Litoreibacter meonggei]